MATKITIQVNGGDLLEIEWTPDTATSDDVSALCRSVDRLLRREFGLPSRVDELLEQTVKGEN